MSVQIAGIKTLKNHNGLLPWKALRELTKPCSTCLYPSANGNKPYWESIRLCWNEWMHGWKRRAVRQPADKSPMDPPRPAVRLD